jgi:DNA (cytosine-5)-methyltransferase 1
MVHLGDICKINGAEIEPVWCITGGSPCQDLSIAGKRAGLAGARSGLFMEQVRIVKEMREADKRNGRTGDMVRPRYLVWENVVGAFSSNQGKDFTAVLEEIIKIVEPEAPGIEVPEKGWPTWGGYHDEVGGRWSVAWRTHDAQYWGVPQRRRRISVVADFGGDTAHEILFDRKSVSGDIAESGAAGEGFAEAAESGFNPAGGDCMTAWDCQSKRIFDTNGKSPTLQGGVGGGVNNPAIFAAIPINDKATRWQGGGESRNHDGSGNGLGIGKEGDPSPTLTAGDRHGVMCMTPWDAQSQRVYDGNGVSPTLSSRENSGLNREAVLCAGFKAGQGAQAGGIGYSEEVSPTLAAAPSGTNQTPAVVALDMTHGCDVIRECGERVPSLQARMGTGGNQVPLVAYGIGNGQANEDSVMAEEVSQTLNTMHDAQAILYQPKSAMEENWAESETKNALRAGESKVSHAVVCEDVSHALRANAGCAYREDAETYPVQNMVVRRLTPLECERLQGFPDGWTDIGDYTDSTGKKRKTSDSARYKALGNSIALPFWRWMFGRMAAYLPEGATLGSLFDGIGGFPLCWENIHGAGTAIWASEIEEFPIAVTKLRFGGAIT